jgi:hypothetical protein
METNELNLVGLRKNPGEAIRRSNKEDAARRPLFVLQNLKGIRRSAVVSDNNSGAASMWRALCTSCEFLYHA